MNGFKKLFCVLSVAILVLGAAGCLQSDGSAVNGTVDVQNQTVLQVPAGLLSQKDSTMALVDEAVSLMDEKGELAFDEFRQKGSKWYHDNTYLSIWTIDGVRVAYASNVSKEGESVIGLKDYNGKALDELFIGTARSDEGEGWVTYSWPKPGENIPSEKYTFVRKASIGNQTYVVTSGFYPGDYVYTNKLEDENSDSFTRFGNVSLSNFLHPATVDRDLGVDYSIAHVIVKPGGSIEAHLMKNPEAYYVLSGEGVLYIEDVPFELGEGQLVLVPANAKQSTVNTGEFDLEFFAIDQPAWAEENEEILE